MSQHVYTYENLEILTGWDRPLQQHFLVVTRTDIPPEDFETDEVVFANTRLDDMAMTVEQVVSTLRALRIPIPQRLPKNLDADREANVGNKCVNYGRVDDNNSFAEYS